MKVSFEGVGEQVREHHFEEHPIDRFMGICIASGDAFAEVKTAGYVELGYSGTAPTVGYATLAADAAAGKVKAVTSGGAQYLVIKVDTAAGTVGFIM